MGFGNTIEGRNHSATIRVTLCRLNGTGARRAASDGRDHSRYGYVTAQARYALMFMRDCLIYEAIVKAADCAIIVLMFVGRA